MLYRTIMRRRLLTGMRDGMLVLGRRLRQDTPRLDGVETIPEQNERDEEGDHPKGHGLIVPRPACSPPVRSGPFQSRANPSDTVDGAMFERPS